MILRVLGVILLSLAAAGIFFVNRRKFNRRNTAGIEEFNSYGKAVATNFFESAVAAGSILIGVLGVLLTFL